MRWWTHGTYEDKKAYLNPSMPYTTLDIAYLAGFLEGEGCFHTNAAKYKVAQVDAVQVNKEPLEYIRERFGGSLRPRKAQREGQSDFWVWQVNGARAREVIRLVYPMLSQRRKTQADVAISKCTKS